MHFVEGPRGGKTLSLDGYTETLNTENTEMVEEGINIEKTTEELNIHTQSDGNVKKSTENSELEQMCKYCLIAKVLDLFSTRLKINEERMVKNEKRLSLLETKVQEIYARRKAHEDFSDMMRTVCKKSGLGENTLLKKKKPLKRRLSSISQ